MALTQDLPPSYVMLQPFVTVETTNLDLDAGAGAHKAGDAARSARL